MGFIKNFYNTNIANGEFKKHKLAYALAIGIGFIGANHGGNCARDLARTGVKMYDQLDDKVEIEMKEYQTQVEQR